MIPALLAAIGPAVLPIIFSLPNPGLQVPGANNVTVSAPVANLQATTTASISGGTNPQVASGPGGPWGSTAQIPAGGTVYARADASSSNDGQNTSTVTIGTGAAAVSDSFTITTCSKPQFAFGTNISGATPGLVYTPASVISNCNLPGTATCTGNGKIANDNIHFGSSASFSNGSVIYLTFTAPPSGQTISATVSFEGQVRSFSVTSA